jgi:hypothetical protein
LTELRGIKSTLKPLVEALAVNQKSATAAVVKREDDPEYIVSVVGSTPQRFNGTS